MPTPPLPATFAFVLVATGFAAAALPPGDHDRTMSFGGATRHYLAHVPPSHDGTTPVPLVLDIHGLTSNAAQQRALSGFLALADTQGFIVVWPDGLNNRWNAGDCCGNPTVDDVGFVRALVATIAAETAIDLQRVYATGLSNGGAMSHRLACDAADVFAAAAPLAFPVPFRPLSECHPVRSIPVLTFMGLTDVLVEYEGGTYPSAAETLAYWRDVNDCRDAAPRRTVAVGESRCEVFEQCASGVEAGLCSITAISFGGTFFDGHILYLNDDVDAAAIAWAFLSRFTRVDAPAPRRLTLEGRQWLPAGPGRPKADPVAWQVTVGQGTWWATDGGGRTYAGSTLRSGGRDILRLSDDALGTLVSAVSERATELAGRPVTFTLAGGDSFRLRVGKRRARLTGRLKLAGGAGARRYRLDLRGAAE